MSKRSDITEDDDWFQGEDKDLIWVIDDGATPPGVPSGMGSWNWLFVLRQSVTSTIIRLTLVPETLDPDEGTVLMHVDKADTLNLPPGTYWYNLGRVDAGEEQMEAHGSAVLSPSSLFRGVVIGAPTAAAGGV